MQNLKVVKRGATAATAPGGTPAMPDLDAKQIRDELPLLWQTPDAWAPQALADPLKLLNDHAHLEKKAAVNALELLNRWPEPNPPENWVHAMTSIAKDEVEHLAVVTRILSRRGGTLTRTHKNPYANDLRGVIRKGEGPPELIDRLMVSALIAARSCERFVVLADACEDAQLKELYGSLYESEAGHYKVFITLARQVNAGAPVESRWREILEIESRIIQDQPPGPRMHSGLAGV